MTSISLPNRRLVRLTTQPKNRSAEALALRPRAVLARPRIMYHVERVGACLMILGFLALALLG